MRKFEKQWASHTHNSGLHQDKTVDMIWACTKNADDRIQKGRS